MIISCIILNRNNIIAIIINTFTWFCNYLRFHAAKEENYDFANINAAYINATTTNINASKMQFPIKFMRKCSQYVSFLHNCTTSTSAYKYIKKKQTKKIISIVIAVIS